MEKIGEAPGRNQSYTDEGRHEARSPEPVAGGPRCFLRRPFASRPSVKGRRRWFWSGFKLALVPVLFLVIFAAVSFFTLTSLRQIRENVLITDLFGRQRMLNQWHMKEILLAGRGIEGDYPYTRAVFDETLEALLHGGPALLTFKAEKRVYLPPAPTEAIREKLEEQKKLWKESTAAADRLLKIPMTDPAS